MVAILTVSCMGSCQTDHEKTTSASRLAAQRFGHLDTSTVDTYPQFEDCNELNPTADCFYGNLHTLIRNRLMIDTLSLDISKKDSLVARFTVHKSGQIVYDSVYRCAQEMDKKLLDSILINKLTNLPVIDSALKQGTPVSSSYLVPIIINPITTIGDQ